MLHEDIKRKQEKTTKFYDSFSKLYDFLSPKSYYHKARLQAVDKLMLKKDMALLNVPVGTGQNFEYFQEYLKDTGSILGVDISQGMLSKAERKIEVRNWNNISLINCDVLKLKETIENKSLSSGFDAVCCDLGLSGFQNWERVIEDLVSLLKPGGRISIMDWYIPKPSLRG